ncbi:SH3 domain-containing protein [Aureispira sp. CCB-QB1]|uniref:SH3 domain-containing protein n=1 Tax=Aureispira sp. CCB-QB1 TaxID=1313421 RepID=UPI000696095B|nr:SH3 domain-containing protein [Aureispira sp. CCB-QB1]
MRTSYVRFFFFIVLSIYFYSCDNQETTPLTNTQTPVTLTQEAPPRRFMETITRRLRVRETPDLEGTVLHILSDGVLVEFLYDSTNFTTEIIYNRKTYNAHWYKIQTEEKIEGWVYAAFVQFLPKEQNQKVVIQRETAELLEAANEERPEFTKKQQKQMQEPVNEGSITNYKNYLANLDRSNPNSIGQAINRFTTLFINHTNENTRDAAYIAFHNFYTNVLKTLQNSTNMNQYQHLATEIKRYQRATMQSDAFTRSLAANGINFGLKNGQVVLAEDVDFLYRVFYRECSIPMRAYMNQYQLEVPNFWLDNETLLIAPKELARWTLSWNYFVATYPDFVWHADAKRRLDKQLNILLQGTEKTPAFDPQTYILKAEFLQAYRHITDNYPESKIGRTFTEYVQTLKRNDWKISSTVTEAQNKVLRLLVL